MPWHAGPYNPAGETESAGYLELSGDVEPVKSKWEECDAALYGYLWTTVLW